MKSLYFHHSLGYLLFVAQKYIVQSPRSLYQLNWVLTVHFNAQHCRLFMCITSFILTVKYLKTSLMSP